ncbi:IS66 family insertion sequence element accessory protein TnpB [Parabacteroides sp.]|uniref:IS66 family insertion sequence element accessory protein TnpB n=1 Tax=Parabacteroides sp. TaxID=1869337 RepID=UPI00257F22FD|nr:IS66 family insertion sequence element accessory protein TnpB [Parabacteroides sp.]
MYICFFQEKRDLVKILHWDTDGFILYQKRLESGTFELPRFKPDEGLCKLQWETFFMIIRGTPLRSTRLRKRF